MHLVAEEDSMTALCEEYGVSRKTGYKWLSRFRAEGPSGLTERSRAAWDPKKLRAKLLARAPEQHWPALSTIGDLLQREGLKSAP